MIGCMGKATSDDLNFDRDEMDDVRWVTRAEVTAALKVSQQRANPYLGEWARKRGPHALRCAVVIWLSLLQTDRSATSLIGNWTPTLDPSHSSYYADVVAGRWCCTCRRRTWLLGASAACHCPPLDQSLGSEAGAMVCADRFSSSLTVTLTLSSMIHNAFEPP